MTRWSIAQQTGRRGAGLGNEVFALAKAQIGARVLGAELVEQPWWLNPRRYGALLGPNLLPPLWARMRGSRSYTVVLDRGRVANIWDYDDSMMQLMSDLPTSCRVVHASGMKGGFLGIRSARNFLRERLGVAGTSEPSAGLRIGVHLRAGDFTVGQVQPGAWNTRLPTEWVTDAVAQVAMAWAGPVELIVHTDAGPGDGTVPEFEQGLPRGLRPTYPRGNVLQDLRSLASCDVIVPSISSFSMLAIFLSGAKYVWPRQGLSSSEGWLSLWGHDPLVAAGPTARAIAHQSAGHADRLPRGLPMGQEAPTDLAEWIRSLPETTSTWPAESDLIMYGAVRAP